MTFSRTPDTFYVVAKVELYTLIDPSTENVEEVLRLRLREQFEDVTLDGEYVVVGGVRFKISVSRADADGVVRLALARAAPVLHGTLRAPANTSRVSLSV